MPSTAPPGVRSRATDERRFSILDISFEASGPSEALVYLDGFIDAYEDQAAPVLATPGRVSPVRASVGSLLDAEGAEGRVVWVHRSKHPYWNVEGRATANGVRWLSRPVTTGWDAGTLSVAASPRLSAVVAGETLWHVCRSVALYLRDPSGRKLLHASAVAFGTRAVLFIGGVSAGKTTFLTEAIVRHGARPLANDRVVVTVSHPVRAYSWPSYASFTEGTLLDHPALRARALAYEDGAYPLRTEHWGHELRRNYTKNAKRFYPMRWLVDALDRPYAAAAEVTAIFLTKLSPDADATRFERLDLEDRTDVAALESMLEQEGFDGREPSFLAWHGLSLPAGAVSAADLVEALATQGIPVARIEAPPATFRRVLASALEEVL